MVDIEIVFSQHVMDQMVDRGTSEEEIKLTIRGQPKEVRNEN